MANELGASALGAAKRPLDSTSALAEVDPRAVLHSFASQLSMAAGVAAVMWHSTCACVHFPVHEATSTTIAVASKEGMAEGRFIETSCRRDWCGNASAA